MKRLCVLAALAGFLLGATPAAAAMGPPELFVRTHQWQYEADIGPWVPLASAPVIDYLGGYEIGYKLQASGEPYNRQNAALTVTGVPDGHPTRPTGEDSGCATDIGDPGTIQPAGPALQFEGDGTYTVKVAVAPGVANGDDCQSGPSRTDSFSVDVHVAPVLVGEPFTFRAAPVPGNPFAGVQAPAPPGGYPDVRCALGALSIPGDASKPSLAEDDFPRPGAWSCMARGAVEGVDDNLDSAVYGTPWSAPLAVGVHSDFRRAKGRVSRARSKRPRFTFVAEWPDLAVGGRASFTLSRFAGCKHRKPRLRKAGSYHGRFDAQRMQVTIRRPRKSGYYTARFRFGGTQFLRAGVDPFPLYLQVKGKRTGFADPRLFPTC